MVWNCGGAGANCDIVVYGYFNVPLLRCRSECTPQLKDVDLRTLPVRVHAAEVHLNIITHVYPMPSQRLCHQQLFKRVQPSSSQKFQESLASALFVIELTMSTPLWQ